ncbi:hydroxyethylthiazole kinase [Thiorhodovibrio frisius]|uniref:Hydroxyethylthiazole kinase n=1 Tax=Thiorhodovibrio frisius TaxID=631362 RepID=H8Z603_9GAMM|nr:hydroxyethylthiazole kinase [Thiorhodovibrio frisius]EIC20653.1 hydroxyethylthiazole kinase, sugar kinase family [Thiorhodovibrio frisius]WPL21401.1 Hydroxyethylthiazole kinase [Thiorhodovibrio frisius]
MSAIRPGDALHRLRKEAPLVHNITNYVAMNPMANILLAAGCSPAMVHAPEEAAEFAAIASALTVNIGTLSRPWLEAMLSAAEAARAHQRPWVLDPVAAGATRFRREAAARLLELQPTVIRGNASEILALGASAEVQAATEVKGRGVDSNNPVAAAAAVSVALAKRHNAVVAVTGPTDWVTDGRRAANIGNGHPLMPRVTALGCSLTGIIGGFLGAGCDPYEGTLAALAYYGAAGEWAAQDERWAVQGPGSFAVAFVDALALMSADQLERTARIESMARADPTGTQPAGTQKAE